MTGRQPITAGLDGSPESLAAVDWAAREALRRELPLHLVHVFDRPSRPSGLPEIDAPAQRERDALDRAVLRISTAYPDLGILDEEVPGSPVRELLAAAAYSTLCVLGSRGLGALTGALVGSVAAAVAARASCPVVLVRADERPWAQRRDQVPGPHGPVVLGLDLDHPCDELLEFAFVTAALRGAPLHVLHAWAVSLAPGADAPVLAKSHLLTAALAPWRHEFPATQVTERLPHGAAGRRLVDATPAAGLLVLGRRIAAGPHFGATAHAVIHHATSPVAIVPHR
ncbi:universal stress protein [Streptomyces luteocolor]|uniref:universal stress protein n=1 Tax=Streptomyces luteocolor TaxID=285500 RepID=UPI0008537AF1|nr:universal stress protein [Streptomyces luteocolor]